MNRQAVIFATLAPAFGLGLFLLSRRQQATSFAGGAAEAPSETERRKLAEQVEDIMVRIGKTSEALERAMERAEASTHGATAAFFDQVRKAVLGATVTTTGLGLLGGLIVLIYAPERYQQERLWQTTKSVLAPVGGTVAIMLRRSHNA
ncbi:MAG: hypothetical protein HYX94_03890 [Chloroflexi bacterium]|nr:hypothetical protein [Chloroflexota bacterium]